MKYKITIILVYILHINLAKTQMLPIYHPFHFQGNTGSCYILNTQYSSQSNSFSYPFIHHFINNKYINKQIKDYNPYKKNVLALYEWLNEAHNYIKPDSLFGTDNTGLHFSTKYNQWFSLSTAKDLIKMMLYGNKHYANKEININSSKLYYLNFYSLTFGLFRKYTFNSFMLKTIFDINFHIFKEIQYLNIPQGSIFTANDGTYVDIFLNSTYQASKQYSPGLSFNMGLQWHHFKSQTIISFNVYQLGFSKLARKSEFARVDTSIRFEGFEIQNVLSQPTFQSGLLSNDSLTNYYKTFIDTHTSYLRIPEIMRFSVLKKWQHRTLTESGIGITYVFHTQQSIPELYVLQKIAIIPNLHFSTGATFFGFSFINPFFSLNYRNSKNWEIELFYTNPLSLLYKQYPYNNSIQILFKKAL